MLLRRASAVCQSFASKPTFVIVSLFAVADLANDPSPGLNGASATRV
jgi:hypothetical protein